MRFKVTPSAPRTGLRMLADVKLTSDMRRNAQRFAQFFDAVRATEGQWWSPIREDFSGLRFGEMLGAGLYRTVFRKGAHVYKVCTLANARDGGNLSEQFFMRQLREDGWGWLAPDVASIPVGEYVVNVMRYYAPVSSYWSPLEQEISAMMFEEYTYCDAVGANLIISADTGLPVLIDGGNWTIDVPQVSRQEILERT